MFVFSPEIDFLWASFVYFVSFVVKGFEHNSSAMPILKMNLRSYSFTGFKHWP